MQNIRRVARTTCRGTAAGLTCVLAVSMLGPGGPAAAQEAAVTEQGTLAQVRDRGRLACGVNGGLAGFASVDSNNVWSGFEVEFCRAMAAAVLGDASLVDIVPLPANDRFAALVAGDVDLVARGAAWSVSPDTAQGVDLVAVSYYDQLGFLLPVELGVSSARELGMAAICVPADVTTGPALDDFFRANNLTYQAMPAAGEGEARQMYLSEQCDTYARAASELYAIRATFETPANHMIVTDPSSRVPSGPVVRQGDNDWEDVVRWTFHALLAAEELGITSANVREMSASPAANPEINRLLGTEGNVGAMLDLEPDWAVDAIAACGNYGEIFERHIGENTPIGLARGLNALWTRGGLQYTPPFR